VLLYTIEGILYSSGGLFIGWCPTKGGSAAGANEVGNMREDRRREYLVGFLYKWQAEGLSSNRRIEWVLCCVSDKACMGGSWGLPGTEAGALNRPLPAFLADARFLGVGEGVSLPSTPSSTESLRLLAAFEIQKESTRYVTRLWLLKMVEIASVGVGGVHRPSVQAVSL